MKEAAPPREEFLADLEFLRNLTPRFRAVMQFRVSRVFAQKEMYLRQKPSRARVHSRDKVALQFFAHRGVCQRIVWSGSRVDRVAPRKFYDPRRILSLIHKVPKSAIMRYRSAGLVVSQTFNGAFKPGSLNRDNDT